MSVQATFAQLVCLLFAAMPVSVVAQVADKPKPDVINSGDHIGQVVVALMFVVAMIFALAWFFKKMGHGSLVGSQHIKLVANMPLGTRERIALVEVGDKQLLLGITAHQINTLHSFDEPVVSSDDPKELSEFGKKIKEIIGSGGVKS
ncbi:MAG: flagellar biosynthetic protein FliO [Candidatus Pelagadaptatus aseana]|uniref:flagellar biosynthetic protein FliO n=1 Tax=Candidatus Pelagadaptatus aseana TaxID=3120508 RepID=UPI0039B1695B